MSVPDGSADKRLPELLYADYVEDSHFQAFAEALHADENALDATTDVQSPGPPPSPAPSGRVRKVSALSDFAPVNVRVSRRRKRREKVPGKRSDWLYLILRWPLLILIFIFIAAEFGLYVLIRQVVNTKEWISAWRGQKGVLRKRMRAAKTYEEWKAAAVALDEYLHFEEWKKVDEDPYYDWKLVRKVRRSLKSLREKNDARGCLGVLETCIRPNFAGVESARLYSETFYGTKDPIESYYDEQEKALRFIRESPDLSIDEKKRFFKSANTNLGITALCLSGGASFGYYHFGVVKAFLDAGLLPRVITGTSAGGLVAALVGTRTDEELRTLLVPELAHRITACEEDFSVWIKRFWKEGARFDSVQWAKKCSYFTRGSLTFKEAFLRTGRVLNISVIPADRHSPTKLLNYITAPDTVIWSAVLASAAVPGILNPVVLMQKLKDGSLVPWNFSTKFKDGSLRVDIPVQALNLYFNVTHPIVSQVNPHVHLFFFAPRGSAGKPVAHRKGKGWRGNFLLSAGEQWLKHELTKNFRVIRDLELMPQILGQDWSSVFLQRFDGAVTIWPRTRFWDWIRILSDPDPAELERMMQVGQYVTWPKLHMISNRLRIEREIYLGRQAVRRATQSKSARNLPLEPHSRIPGTGVAETNAGAPRIETTPPPTGSDVPMSIDTEAEAAFKNGSEWFFERGHGGHHGRHLRSTSASRDTEREDSTRQNGNGHAASSTAPFMRDPLRSSVIRRKWAADLLHRKNTAGRDVESPQDFPTDESAPRPGSFLSRLRERSFGAREASPSGSATPENPWSSDSSSGDDVPLEELQRYSYGTGVVRPPLAGTPEDEEDIF
ncbi:acyl transferase/acyl hydrolase/lysophospholipase [Schizophyllum commune]